MTTTGFMPTTTANAVFNLRARYEALKHLAASEDDERLLITLEKINQLEPFPQLLSGLQGSEGYTVLKDVEPVYIDLVTQTQNIENLLKQVKFLERFRLNNRVKDYVRKYLKSCRDYYRSQNKNPSHPLQDREKTLLRGAFQVIPRVLKSLDKWRNSEEAIAGIRKSLKIFRNFVANDIEVLVKELDLTRHKLLQEESARRQEQGEDDFHYRATIEDFYDHLIEGQQYKHLHGNLYFRFTDLYFQISQKMKQFYGAVLEGKYGDELKNKDLTTFSRETLLAFCLLDSYKDLSMKRALNINLDNLARFDRELYRNFSSFKEWSFKEKSSDFQEETRVIHQRVLGCVSSLLPKDFRESRDLSDYRDQADVLVKALIKDDVDNLPESLKPLASDLKTLVGRVQFYGNTKTREGTESPKQVFDREVFEKDEVYKAFDEAQKELKLIAVVLEKVSRSFSNTEDQRRLAASDLFKKIAEKDYSEENDRKLGTLFIELWMLVGKTYAIKHLDGLRSSHRYKFLISSLRVLLDLGLFSDAYEIVKKVRSTDQKVEMLNSLLHPDRYRRDFLADYLEVLEIEYSLIIDPPYFQDRKEDFLSIDVSSEKFSELDQKSQERYLRLCLKFQSAESFIKYFSAKFGDQESCENAQKAFFDSWFTRKMGYLEPKEMSVIYELIEKFPTLKTTLVQFLAIHCVSFLGDQINKQNIDKLLALDHSSLNVDRSVALLLPLLLIESFRSNQRADEVVSILKFMENKISQEVLEELDENTREIYQLFSLFRELFEQEDFREVLLKDDYLTSIQTYNPKEELKEAFFFYQAYAWLWQGMHHHAKMANFHQKLRNPVLKQFLRDAYAQKVNG